MWIPPELSQVPPVSTTASNWLNLREVLHDQVLLHATACGALSALHDKANQAEKINTTHYRKERQGSLDPINLKLMEFSWSLSSWR